MTPLAVVALLSLLLISGAVALAIYSALCMARNDDDRMED